MLKRWMTMAGLAVVAALLGTSAGAQPRTLTEMDLWLRGVSAQVADLAPVAPKAIASSVRVAVKAGFRPEGIRRGAAMHADGWHDMHVHSLLAGDAVPA